MGKPTLYIIDDKSASTALTEKKDMSGRHAEQSVWVITQKYISVLKDLREQTRWVCLFHCKDRDSFEDCLRENDVIPIYYSPRGYWKGLTAIKKLASTAKLTEQQAKDWLKKAGHLTDLSACSTIHTTAEI